MMGISNFADRFATATAPTNEVAAEPLPPEDAAQAFASLLAAAYTPTQSAPVTEMAIVSEVPAQTFAPTPAASGFTLPIDFLNSRDSKSASVEITDTSKASNTVSASTAEPTRVQLELPEKMAVTISASSQSADATPLTFSAETAHTVDSTEPDVLPATSSEKIAAPETKETPSPDRLSGVISKQSPDLNPAVTFRQEVKDESRVTIPDAPHREPEMLRNNSVETRELEKPALPTPAISPPLAVRKVDSPQKASPILVESPPVIEPSSSPVVMQSSSDETSAKLQEQPVPGDAASIEREIIEVVELQEHPIKITGLQAQPVESAAPKNELPSLPTASIKAPTSEINGAVQQVKSESEPQIVKGQKDVSWASVEVRALFTPVVVQGNSEAIKLAMAAVKTLVAENHPDTASPQSGALITEPVSVAVAPASEVVPSDVLLPQGKPTTTVVPQVSEVVRRILAQVNEPALPAATSTVEVDTQSEAVRTEAARTTARVNPFPVEEQVMTLIDRTDLVPTTARVGIFPARVIAPSETMAPKNPIATAVNSHAENHSNPVIPTTSVVADFRLPLTPVQMAASAPPAQTPISETPESVPVAAARTPQPLPAAATQPPVTTQTGLPTSRSMLELQAAPSVTQMAIQENLRAEDLSDGTSRQTFSVNHSVNSQIAPEVVSAREAPPIVNQTIQPVIEVAQSINARETRSLQLELNPMDLGRVKVEITRDAEGRVSASLVVEQTETAQTLTQNLGHLRESLERAGVVVEHLTVTTAQLLQSQTSQQFGQQFGQQSSQQNTSSNHYSDADSLRSDQTSGEEISPASDNKLLSMRA